VNIGPSRVGLRRRFDGAVIGSRDGYRDTSRDPCGLAHRTGQLIAGLARMVRDVGMAEELAQEALVVALERWPETAYRTIPAPG